MPIVKKKVTPEVPRPVAVESGFETKAVLMGFATGPMLAKVDDEGLPLILPESMGKEYHEFNKALAKFAALDWLPLITVDFPGAGGHYLIFKREKV